MAGEQPGTVRPPGGPTLYDAIVALLTGADPLDDGPLHAVREKLWVVAGLLAKERGEAWRDWAVYVERHIVGVRFILRDARGNEVDLQTLPAGMGKLLEPVRSP